MQGLELDHSQKKKLQQYLTDLQVLVIEPSVNYKNSLKQFLINLKVINGKYVSSVADAKREMLTMRVGLFIVEWALDTTNGIQFCRDLRKEPQYKDTPFLLMSVENLKKDVILASEVNIDAYMIKPFSYEDFCSQLILIQKTQTAQSEVNLMLDQAEHLTAKGNHDEAEPLFDQVLKLKENSARAYCGKAKIKWFFQDHEAAMHLLRVATNFNPEYIDAYKTMLDICEQRQDRTGLVQAASILTSMSPENPKYTLILAKAYLELNHLEGSENYYKKTIMLSPKLADAYKGLGSVYMAQNEYEKAKKNFRKALDLDADDISTLNSLGTTLLRMGQFNEGINRYLLALKLDPSNPSVLFNIGHAYEKNNDFEKAKWYYAQALIHKPGFDKAMRGLERVEGDEITSPKDGKKTAS
jgi:tetratricopeptide (TPR) repeat protein